jgi:RNA polymerase sigma-70 factor, ECF subfamily
VNRETKGLDHSSLVLAQSILCPGPSPSLIAEAKELADRVAAVIGELDDEDREILLLRQIEDMPYDEVALLLGIESATARKRYGRALIKLQDRLKSQGLMRTMP